MYLRRTFPAFCGILIYALSHGCGLAASPANNATGATKIGTPKTVARIHWVGKKHLASETNATAFMGIWNLPESARLEAQTLQKLTVAVLRGLGVDPSTTNAAENMIRPLLEDLVLEEWHFEARAVSEGPGEVALAIRLSAERAALWETNLVGILKNAKGFQYNPATGNRRSWSATTAGGLNHLELARAGTWTIVDWRRDQAVVLSNLLVAIQQRGTPAVVGPTNFWLEGELDVPGLAHALAVHWQIPEAFPKASFTLIGDGENVRTRAQLNFPKPLSLGTPAWNFPTNLISDPVISFTAVRGFAEQLASVPWWADRQLGNPPDQAFFWAQTGVPFQMYCAAPVPDASNRVTQLRTRLLSAGNTWLDANARGAFQRTTNFNGVKWAMLPFTEPFLESRSTKQGDFVVAGLFPPGMTNRPVPAKLLQEFYNKKGLVYYDWELTGARIDSWLHVGQLFRLIFRKAQVPLKSASIIWLQALAPNLGNCATVILEDGPQQLSVTRRSTIGLTSSELQLLADWLESPAFPEGLYTLLAPGETPPQRKRAPQGTASLKDLPTRPATNRVH